MARKKSNLKQFDAYIEGDGELRKAIFSERPSPQQVVFELFNQLDHAHHSLILFFSAIPSNGFWDILLAQLAAIAGGSARNRNFCEDYELLRPVAEERTCYSSLKDKAVDLVGASHALWYEMADPNYAESPNALNIYTSFLTLAPNRMVWEWWFEVQARAAIKIVREFKADLRGSAARLEHWGRQIGLHKPRLHAYATALRFAEAYEQATSIKHKIAKPYLRLVYTITKSIAAYNQPEQFFDTFNIACAGLMRSIAKYAPSMAMAFAHFADREIRYEIYYQLSNYNLVSLPHKSWQKYREYEELRKKFQETYQREASPEDLVETYSLPREEVYEIYRQVAMQNPHSLDQKIFGEDRTGSTSTLKDRIEDPRCQESRQWEENQEVMVMALLRMSLKDRKLFVSSRNLCDLALDMRPDQTELSTFFQGLNFIQKNAN